MPAFGIAHAAGRAAPSAAHALHRQSWLLSIPETQGVIAPSPATEVDQPPLLRPTYPRLQRGRLPAPSAHAGTPSPTGQRQLRCCDEDRSLVRVSHVCPTGRPVWVAVQGYPSWLIYPMLCRTWPKRNRDDPRGSDSRRTCFPERGRRPYSRHSILGSGQHARLFVLTLRRPPRPLIRVGR